MCSFVVSQEQEWAKKRTFPCLDVRPSYTTNLHPAPSVCLSCSFTVYKRTRKTSLANINCLKARTSHVANLILYLHSLCRAPSPFIKGKMSREKSTESHIYVTQIFTSSCCLLYVRRNCLPLKKRQTHQVPFPLWKLYLVNIFRRRQRARDTRSQSHGGASEGRTSGQV